MAAKDLNSRRDNILELIINSHIASAAPIASRAISKKLRLRLSPATIRNVMSDLEEMGLIMHPHTSAGRIPTEKGYRYYIDRLMEAGLLTEDEKKQINKEFKEKVSELDDILSKASQILSSITNQTGIVLFPILQRSVFEHIEFLRLGKDRLLTVLMTESGLAEDIIIDIGDEIEDSDLVRVSNFINSHMGKGSLNKIRKDIMQKLLAERDSFFYILDRAKRIIDSMLGMISENRIYLDGRLHITQQPEFDDINKMRNLFMLLEDKESLTSLLKKDIDEEGVKVYIGSELNNDFADYSLITSTYCIGGTSCGTLGIIGPIRMDYAKLISIVSYVATALTRALNER